jgi:hypothetical protein
VRQPSTVSAAVGSLSAARAGVAALVDAGRGVSEVAHPVTDEALLTSAAAARIRLRRMP